ncbi:MAG: 6-carboxytetrahydropterin synthase QueD [Chitinivibrionales bacterium]
MYEISSEISFSASHRLVNYNGPCENLHGHNWLVRGYVQCEHLNEIGLGIDFKKLKSALKAVTDTLDHVDLNKVLAAHDINPSSENIAKYIYDELKKELAEDTCRVSKVEVYETPGNCAAYFEHA